MENDVDNMSSKMRTESEILAEYDREYAKYVSVEKTDDYIRRINYLIRSAIRALNPCYHGTTKYCHAEIYTWEADDYYSESIEDRYKGLYKLWHEAPYVYEISDADKVRINGILVQNFTLDKFTEVIDTTGRAIKEWDNTKTRLLDEYETIPKDMENLLREYLDLLIYRTTRCVLHPFLELFVEQRCNLTLTQARVQAHE